MIRDPWEPLAHRPSPRQAVLSSVEVSVTNMCNLRCAHCAVGDQLMGKDPFRLPVETIIDALDQAPDLKTLSLTGGEPMVSREVVEQWVTPLLRYAKDRGLATQVNSNLTLPLERYLPLEGLIDVLHVSWNYRDQRDFEAVSGLRPAAAEKLFRRMLDNMEALSARGWFVSAESMMTPETAAYLGAFNRRLGAQGCRRHEVHPRYPVSWAAALPVLSLEETAAAVERLLDERDPDVWILFGTFPFFPCSPEPSHRALWRRVQMTPNTTIRNDPDGRSRLNVDGMTGRIRVTDFGNPAPLGSILDGVTLPEAFARYQEDLSYKPYRCVCPEAGCLGPNGIVARTYFQDVDFTARRALEPLPAAAGL